MRQARGGFLDDREQGGRNERDFGPRVLEEVVILIDREARVHQNRHDAGPDRAPEQDRKVDGVQQDERDPVFLLDAEQRQHRADARGAFAQLAVCDAARRIDESDLRRASFGDLAVDEIDGGIIVAKAHAAPPARRCG